jgi:hypothetical protein
LILTVKVLFIRHYTKDSYCILIHKFYFSENCTGPDAVSFQKEGDEQATRNHAERAAGSAVRAAKAGDTTTG